MPEWQDITDDEFEAANGVGEAERARGFAVSVRYYATGRRLSVHLSTGAALMVPVDLLEGLAGAGDAELRDVLLNPGGLGLHFPQLDADISVSGLLDGVFGSRKWMAEALGRAGGAARTDRKAAAARENGRRGGRPRKVSPAAPQPIRYVQQHMSGDGAVAVTIQEGGNAYQPITAARALEGLLSGEFRVLPSDSAAAATLRPGPSVQERGEQHGDEPLMSDPEILDRMRAVLDGAIAATDPGRQAVVTGGGTDLSGAQRETTTARPKRRAVSSSKPGR